MASFKDGDRVHHIGRKEDGTVTVQRNGDIEVLFDRPAPSGKPSIGIFDENWFHAYPVDTYSYSC